MTLKKVYQTKDIYPTFQTEHDSVEDDITADLAKLKFFCGNIGSFLNSVSHFRINHYPLKVDAAALVSEPPEAEGLSYHQP